MKIGWTGGLWGALGVYCLVGCRGPGGIEERAFLGEWEPLSRNHVSILGKMEVSAGKVEFERTGEATFEVISFDGEEYLLRLERGLGEAPIMRLGPIRNPGGAGGDVDIEVAFYDRVDDARVVRERRSSGANSWGVYFRE